MSEQDDKLIIFTGPSPRGWHRLQTAAECLQKYAWSYEMPEGEEPKLDGRAPLIMGSLTHLALAQHYSRMRLEQEGGNPEEFMTPEEAVRFLSSAKKQEKYAPPILETYDSYRRKYFSDIRLWRIVAVETLFDGTLEPSVNPLNESYRLTGRIDLLYEDLAGQLYATDHKTTGRLTKQHREYFTVSGQMLAYEHLVRQQHSELAGFKINLIQHAANDPAKFERVGLARRPALEQQFVDRAVDIERNIERIRAEGRPVDQWPKAMSELTCYTRYGPCEFIEKCRYGLAAKKAGSWEWSDS